MEPKNKKIKKIPILTFSLSISLMFFGTSSALAVNHYIRPNGGNYGLENGSDWNNAFDGFPATMIRGDTYYIAGGDYPMNTSSTNPSADYVYKFDDAEAGTKYIYIKKANADGIADQVAGWQDSFAQTPAVFFNPIMSIGNALKFEAGYYIMDGITGEGKLGHGIVVKGDSNNPNLVKLWLVYNDNTASNVIFKHVAFVGFAEDSVGTNWDVVSLNNRGISNSKFQYCYFKNFNEAINAGGEDIDNILIEHSYFEHAWVNGPSNAHGQVIDILCADNGIVRHNVFEDYHTEGIVVNHGQLWQYPSCEVDNWQIYGNLFLNDNQIDANANAILGAASSCGMNATNWKMYDNTLVNVEGRVNIGVRTGCTSQPGYESYEGTPMVHNFEIKNNLYYNVSKASIEHPEIIYDNNYYNKMSIIPSTATNSIVSTENVYTLFPNYDSGDFHLGENSEARDAGINLGSPYNIDMDGNIRGADGDWDIGAYEYISLQSDTTQPSNPTGLSVR